MTMKVKVGHSLPQKAQYAPILEKKKIKIKVFDFIQPYMV